MIPNIIFYSINKLILRAAKHAGIFKRREDAGNAPEHDDKGLSKELRATGARRRAMPTE